MDLDDLRALVEAEPYGTTREMACTLGVSSSNVSLGLKKLGKVQKLGRWVPHALTQFGLDRRVDACTQLLTLERNFHWLNDLVTGDEKWIA